MSTVQKTMQLQPEYIENFIKDILSNIYKVDDETGEVSGIGATSPLYGVPQFELDAEGNQVLDAEGNPIPIYKQIPKLDDAGNVMKDADGNVITENETDIYGNPIQEVKGGVAPPDVVGFTDPQIRAIEMLAGKYDAEGNYIEGTGGLGAYKKSFDKAQDLMDLGLGAFQKAVGTPQFDAEGKPIYQKDAQGNTVFDSEGNPIQAMSGGFADPSQYKQFYNPYVEQVIDTTQADIQRAGDIQGIGQRAQMVASGAFGGSRQAVTEQEVQRNVEAQKAKTGGELRARAFENAIKMGQNAANLFGNLGTGIGSLATQQGALGESAQASFLKDVNALFNVGTLEQQQLQAQYDVDRAAQLEEAYEPFARFGFMRDIVSGLPSGVTGAAATYQPTLNPIGNIFSTASNIYKPGSGLAPTKNVSGA